MHAEQVLAEQGFSVFVHPTQVPSQDASVTILVSHKVGIVHVVAVPVVKHIAAVPFGSAYLFYLYLVYIISTLISIIFSQFILLIQLFSHQNHFGKIDTIYTLASFYSA